MSGVEMPETPELDKQREVVKEAHRIGEFLDWMSSRGIWLARYERFEEYRDEHLVPMVVDHEQLLADFYGIDRNKIEAERRAILKFLQETRA